MTANGKAPKAKNIIRIIKKLISQGWLPLADMQEFLGYSHISYIYQRQNTKNAIDTIKVGGIFRVDKMTALGELQKRAEASKIAASNLELFQLISRGQYHGEAETA